MLALTIAATIRIGVFGLFHPVQFDVKPAHGTVLIVEANGHIQVLEGSARAHLTSAARVKGRDGRASFVLSVPGKIQREFHGGLEIREQSGHLIAIVEMDRETAVASIVAAEGSDAVPMEARKAQAIVARSFLAAVRGRHKDFDFCDTTHCQFLRDPPAEKSPAHRAGAVTRGQVLTYEGHIVAGLYSANCGGHTRTLVESGWPAREHAMESGAYPYFGVECPVRGVVSGHRIGMCQLGAAAMAQRGASFREILNHYFPATAIVNAEPPQ